jgi:hypothetical protein
LIVARESLETRRRDQTLTLGGIIGQIRAHEG